MGRRKETGKKRWRVETKYTEYRTYEVEADNEDEARSEYYQTDADYGDSDEEILEVDEI